MAELKNPKHEKFVQNIVRGLSRAEAYLSAGYSRNGAHASAARLLKNPQVCTRLAELRKAVEPILEQELVKLLVAERLHRIEAIQDRWDRVRAAINAHAREDYEAMMATGVVCRKKRWIGGKEGYEVEEYEIDTGAIEALNSIEKRAAVETGQEIDRQDINVREDLQAQADVLRKAFTLDELEAMDARIEAARNGTQVVEAPALAVPEVQPVPEGKPGCAAPTAPEPPGAGAAEDGVVPSVPKAPSSWRN